MAELMESDKTPRKMYKRYVTLSGLGWGSVYPSFTNLAVIGNSAASKMSKKFY